MKDSANMASRLAQNFLRMSQGDAASAAAAAAAAAEKNMDEPYMALARRQAEVFKGTTGEGRAQHSTSDHGCKLYRRQLSLLVQYVTSLKSFDCM